MDKWLESKQLPAHLISASGLVFKDGKILLLRSAHRGWEFPGGFIEQGESVLDGVKREILEETGIIAEPVKLAGVYQNISMKEGYGPLEGTFLPPVTIFSIICSYVSGETSLKEDSLEIGWFSPEEAVSKVQNPSYRKRLLDMLAYDGQIHFCSFEKPGKEFGRFRSDTIL